MEKLVANQWKPLFDARATTKLLANEWKPKPLLDARAMEKLVANQWKPLFDARATTKLLANEWKPKPLLDARAMEKLLANQWKPVFDAQRILANLDTNRLALTFDTTTMAQALARLRSVTPVTAIALARSATVQEPVSEVVIEPIAAPLTAQDVVNLLLAIHAIAMYVAVVTSSKQAEIGGAAVGVLAALLALYDRLGGTSDRP